MAASGSLLTVSEIILREHITLATSEEEGGLSVWVCWIQCVEGADCRLRVVEVILRVL